MASNWRESEKCGVIGMVGHDVSLIEAVTAQRALEHRGNGPAGTLILYDDGALSQNLAESPDQLPTTPKSIGARVILGHNRYATSGATQENTQPLVAIDAELALGLAHNGNIPSKAVEELKKLLKVQPTEGASDSAVITQFLIESRKKYPNWIETFINVLPLFKGAFSLACLTDDGNLYAIRDPYSIRPLCIGLKNGEWITASETVALDAIGADYVREVLPGEILCLKVDGSYESITYAIDPNGEKICLLEKIYFSRKKSFDGKDTILHQRENLGKAAAKRFKEKNIHIDWVVPILNSGQSMASGAAAELEIPIFEAIGVTGKKRSFLQNTQEERDRAVYEKHIVFSPEYAIEIAGKSILLCDDSAVRGTSLELLIQRIKALKESGPGQIHILLGSEPVTDICEWGVDLPDKSALLANRVGGKDLTDIEQKVAVLLGVDSVTYLDRASVEKALDRHSNEMCYHCFGGPKPMDENHPPIYRADKLEKLKAQKVLFMASGNGTNVEAILKQMEIGNILAQPMGAITNKANAGVIERAKKYQVPTTVFASAERLKTDEERAVYESELLHAILEGSAGLPDVIVLAGWMLILSDKFVKAVTDCGIKIINLHPALLSGLGKDNVMTSKGEIPEIRGGKAIEETFAQTIEQMPVTGVTVHYVTPSNEVDTGKVILKEEVRRRKTDTLAELESRIHQTEHRVFSVALQRVLLEEETENSK